MNDITRFIQNNVTEVCAEGHKNFGYYKNPETMVMVINCFDCPASVRIDTYDYIQLIKGTKYEKEKDNE